MEGNSNLDQSIAPTPEQVANILMNIPNELREYIVECMPNKLFGFFCWAIVNKKLQRKDFIEAVRKDYNMQIEVDKNFVIEGFKVGEEYFVNTSHNTRDIDGYNIIITGFAKCRFGKPIDVGTRTIKCTAIPSPHYGNSVYTIPNEQPNHWVDPKWLSPKKDLEKWKRYEDRNYEKLVTEVNN